LQQHKMSYDKDSTTKLICYEGDEADDYTSELDNK